MTEAFFYNDEFYSDLEDYIINREIDETEDNWIEQLPEDWGIRVEVAMIEPIFTLTYDKIEEMFIGFNEDRMPEDIKGDDEIKITEAIKSSVDIEKLKEMSPKYYYPNGVFYNITKEDLINQQY
jgi:hypothetical protein